MKKPDIGKRLIPLLDIIMLLLAFFIVLPHGIKSREIVEKNYLESRNRKLDQDVSYYEWQYGALKKKPNQVYQVMTLTVSSDQVYLDTEKIPENRWEKNVKRRIEDENINFVILHISDVAGKYTRQGTISRLEEILEKCNVIHIITYEKKK